MLFMVDVALFGYIPFVFWLFAAMRDKRQAMIWSVLLGVLFLPIAGYKVTGLPQYDKISAVNMVPFLAAVLFDWPRVSRLRPRWFDLPVIIFCFAPLFSSLSNDLGLYDGISEVLNHAPAWGPCYFLGRIYCADLAGLRALAIAFIAGGLIYVPFCLYEIRMSPQFHCLVYGYHQHNILQQMRYDGFRPMVFMQHGLAVSLWMVCCSMIGIILWRTKAITQLWGLPISWWVVPLTITAFMCKSLGAILIMVFGLLAFYIMKVAKYRIIIFILVLVPPIYMAGRLTGVIDRTQVTTFMTEQFGQERSQSLDSRMEQEDLFSAKVMSRPIFGWGGWGRSWPTDENGNNITRGLDSLWVMFLGCTGFTGLISMTLMFLTPGILMLKRGTAALWTHPAGAAAGAMSTILIMYMIDNLFNAMQNPMYLVAAGAVNGWVMQAAVPADEAAMQPVLTARAAKSPASLRSSPRGQPAT